MPSCVDEDKMEEAKLMEEMLDKTIKTLKDEAKAQKTDKKSVEATNPITLNLECDDEPFTPHNQLKNLKLFDKVPNSLKIKTARKVGDKTGVVLGIFGQKKKTSQPQPNNARHNGDVRIGKINSNDSRVKIEKIEQIPIARLKSVLIDPKTGTIFIPSIAAANNETEKGGNKKGSKKNNKKSTPQIIYASNTTNSTPPSFSSIYQKLSSKNKIQISAPLPPLPQQPTTFALTLSQSRMRSPLVLDKTPLVRPPVPITLAQLQSGTKGTLRPNFVPTRLPLVQQPPLPTPLPIMQQVVQSGPIMHKVPTPTQPPPQLNYIVRDLVQETPQPPPQPVENGVVGNLNGTTGTGTENDTNNNKTFPSLIVFVRPNLQEKLAKMQTTKARSDLDTKVKGLLVLSPSSLIEWMLKKGLLRSEQTCEMHSMVPCKLGLFSDRSKFPFSGGYVWISPCCSNRQNSVFTGSIFESATYSPTIMIKLIYHWACQTSAQSVLQWVKVSSYFLKNFYTLLRSVCIASLHENCQLMGGLGKAVEVGVITLGTSMPQNSQAGAIKIEILGVYDATKKIVRLKVINSQNPDRSDGRSNSRASEILWPLKHWVHMESMIQIDTSIEKSYLFGMGFKFVTQSKAGNAGGNIPINSNIMNYLKMVVPKMFQNTLCVLSKTLVQQFLDELCWRELWGLTSLHAFDNILSHISQLTRAELGESLISRLNKISMSPYDEWSYSKNTPSNLPLSGIDLLPASIRTTGTYTPSHSLQLVSNNVERAPQVQNSYGGNTKKTTGRPLSKNIEKTKRNAEDVEKEELKSYYDKHEKDKNRDLLDYYYSQSIALTPVNYSIKPFLQNLKCPHCTVIIRSNTEILSHLATHVNPVDNKRIYFSCDYCLKQFTTKTFCVSHQDQAHKKLGSTGFCCLICETHFEMEKDFIVHMWQKHSENEMPYRCEICHYQSSVHSHLIDHFSKEHTGCSSVLCPICLKVLDLKDPTDLHYMADHIRDHKNKTSHRCTKCCLSFMSVVDKRFHDISYAHLKGSSILNFISPLFPSDGPIETRRVLMPTPPGAVRNENNFSLGPLAKKHKNMNEKSKTPPKPPSHHPTPAQLENVKFSKSKLMTGLLTCAECRESIVTPDHFSGCFKCSKCPFFTSCQVSMLNHHRDSHSNLVTATHSNAQSHSRPILAFFKKNREFEGIGFSCSKCGARVTGPDALMKHMVACGSHTGSITSEPVVEVSDEDMPQLEAEVASNSNEKNDRSPLPHHSSHHWD